MNFPTAIAAPTASPTLTGCQQKAADAFFAFLHSDAKTFAISGPAGVGKTFLMGHLSNRVMSMYEASCKMLGERVAYDTVVFTATTNKAAEVLEQSLGKPTSTIHSYMALKVQNDYRTGKTYLERTKSWSPKRRTILFVDEASMVDSGLFNEILETMQDSKIIFVGDHAQMAPIGESLSKVYTEVLEENMVILSEPVRNAESPALMALCNQLRQTVETGIFHPIQEVPGTIDYLTNADMDYGLDYVFSDLNPSCRVLCYTNERVQQYIETIRQDVRNLPPQFTPNDVVVAASQWSRGKLSISVEREFIVKEVSELKTSLIWSDMFKTPILYRDLTLHSSLGEELENIPVAEDPLLVADGIKYLAKKKQWSDYFELKNEFLDLRDKAACTVYKGQGSTYDMVFIDIGNIGTSYDAEQVARMLYVAVSRAKTRVYLYGQLTGRYHNSQGKQLWIPSL